MAELHGWLVATCGLVPERAHGGSWRTYFAGRVEWHPARTTRVLKVLLDHGGVPWRIQLCASSDPNHGVFVSAPFEKDALRRAIEAEVALRVRARGAA